MELRLLHTAAHGVPWFAHWGYRFVSGTHGVTSETYAAAIAAVHTTPLSTIVNLHYLVSRYTCLSQKQLRSFGDLFRLLLDLLRRIPFPSPLSTKADFPCRWPRKRIEVAAYVIVQALKNTDLQWMSRQQVRDAARTYVGDTGLLDYVLKSLGNHIFGNFLVRRCHNPVTKVLQYSLVDLSSSNPQLKSGCNISRAQVSMDLAQMYTYLFNSASNSLLSVAGQVILDAKHLVKEFSAVSVIPPAIACESNMYCAVQIRQGEGKLSPAEYFCFGKDATVEGLRVEVEKEFREIYWGMKECMVGSIAGCEGNVDCKFLGGDMVEGMGRGLVFDVVKDGGDGDVYEKGVGEVVVDCDGCGAREDDGERMVCCDICEVRVHTRCVSIPKGEKVPPIFICRRCEDAIVVSPSFL